MKKFFLFVTSVITIVSLAALPMACSHDDEESDGANEVVPVQNVQTYQGTLLYGTLSKDSVTARITKSEGSISISVSTNIPYLSYDFSDVSIKVSGDTSYLRAQNETIDTGSDAQLTLALNGMMYDNCSQLYLVVTGTELNDTLFFATDKAMLGKGSSNEKEVVDGLTEVSDAYRELMNGTWEGIATYDGVDSGTITFTTSIDENGHINVDLGKCKFSEKMPEMNIVLNNMVIDVPAGEEPDGGNSKKSDELAFEFFGSSATYTMGKVEGQLGAEVKGDCNSGVLNLGLGLSVMNKEHTIAIANATRK